MNPTTFYDDQMAIVRKLTLDTLIDTCNIKRLGVSTVDGRGIATKSTPTDVTYNGSTEIPCRVDVARAFMNDRTLPQVVVTDNYALFLPHDIDIQENDNVIWKEQQYDIRKLIRAGEMSAYTEAMIVVTDRVQ